MEIHRSPIKKLLRNTSASPTQKWILLQEKMFGMFCRKCSIEIIFFNFVLCSTASENLLKLLSSVSAPGSEKKWELKPPPSDFTLYIFLSSLSARPSSFILWWHFCLRTKIISSRKSISALLFGTYNLSTHLPIITNLLITANGFWFSFVH